MVFRSLTEENKPFIFDPNVIYENGKYLHKEQHEKKKNRTESSHLEEPTKEAQSDKTDDDDQEIGLIATKDQQIK